MAAEDVAHKPDFGETTDASPGLKDGGAGNVGPNEEADPAGDKLQEEAKKVIDGATMLMAPCKVHIHQEKLNGMVSWVARCLQTIETALLSQQELLGKYGNRLETLEQVVPAHGMMPSMVPAHGMMPPMVGVEGGHAVEQASPLQVGSEGDSSLPAAGVNGAGVSQTGTPVAGASGAAMTQADMQVSMPDHATEGAAQSHVAPAGAAGGSVQTTSQSDGHQKVSPKASQSGGHQKVSSKNAEQEQAGSVADNQEQRQPHPQVSSVARATKSGSPPDGEALRLSSPQGSRGDLDGISENQLFEFSGDRISPASSRCDSRANSRGRLAKKINDHQETLRRVEEQVRGDVQTLSDVVQSLSNDLSLRIDELFEKLRGTARQSVLEAAVRDAESGFRSFAEAQENPPPVAATTATTSDVPAGSTEIFVADVADLSPGASVTISNDTGTESKTVVDCTHGPKRSGTVTFDSPLKLNYARGSVVEVESDVLATLQGSEASPVPKIAALPSSSNLASFTDMSPNGEGSVDGEGTAGGYNDVSGAAMMNITLDESVFVSKPNLESALKDIRGDMDDQLKRLRERFEDVQHNIESKIDSSSRNQGGSSDPLAAFVFCPPPGYNCASCGSPVSPAQMRWPTPAPRSVHSFFPQRSPRPGPTRKIGAAKSAERKAHEKMQEQLAIAQAQKARYLPNIADLGKYDKLFNRHQNSEPRSPKKKVKNADDDSDGSPKRNIRKHRSLPTLVNKVPGVVTIGLELQEERLSLIRPNAKMWSPRLPAGRQVP